MEDAVVSATKEQQIGTDTGLGLGLGKVETFNEM
jgi:hypothetical protein